MNNAPETCDKLCYIFIALVLLDAVIYNMFKVKGLYVIEAALLVICVAIFIKKRKLGLSLSVLPITIWGIWVVYSLVNWTHTGIQNERGSVSFKVISYMLLPLSTMIFTYIEGSRNFDKMLRIILWSLVVYVVLGYSLQTGNNITFETNERGMFVLGNHLALSSCVLAFFVCLSYSRKLISSRLFYILLFLTFFSIFVLATRKALGGWTIVFIFFILGRYNISRKSSNVFYLTIVLIAMLMAYTYIMENTFIGERLSITAETGMKNNDTRYEYLNYLGDRAVFYIMGWDVFLDNPLTGIGLTNYPAYTHTNLVLHTEYMTQLAEGGIIGTTLYVIFILSILFALWKSRKTQQIEMITICFGGIFCVLFIGITAWTYSVPCYFAIYGMVLAYSKPLK